MFRSLSANTRTRKYPLNYSTRSLSKYLDKDITSKAIRQQFLDYFINDCNHNFVRSSPVVPLCDPSVAFVNAGMNQFKGILLGTQTPQYSKVANSQKCIRIGGKHNDLNVVGLDGYHHTFFEMLGNWSFGDYFKKEACQMAWNLLTKKYKINENILYVTYFAGNDGLELPPDIECRDIWRSIGVPEERILPFGIKDNFWEMGPTGPCGPCTEIHADLLLNGNRAQFVNKGLPDLTELWNIVFIQYNRCLDGSIQPLPQKHIDTGMGFERLVALLQGKISNYDTDIFTNILSAITKSCKGIPSYDGKFGEQDWNNLDMHYRILADHARMIIVSLGDGIIPEQNQKLRRVMRKAFQLSETVFKKESGLLKELSNYVVENLGSVYTEMERNIKQIHQVINYEEELYKFLRDNSAKEWQSLVNEETNLQKLDIIEMPGLIAAYKDIKAKSQSLDRISPSVGFRLYDTFGLDEETISKLSAALNLDFDVEGFRKEMLNAKIRSRNQALTSTNELYECLKDCKEKKTDNTYKYDYKRDRDGYVFNTLDVQVLKVFSNNDEVQCIEPGMQCYVLLDKSSLYYDAGGQINDRGSLHFNDATFEIDKVLNINGYILHKGVLKSNNEIIPINTKGTLQIDKDLRLKNMRNHTATHLLNLALKYNKGVTYQKSSVVNPNFLNLDVGVFSTKFGNEDVEPIEELINSLIRKAINVKISEIDSQDFLSLNDVTVLPGEIYPESGIRLVEIAGGDELLSREPCCGTHVFNTGDIEDFCIIGFHSLGRSTTSIFAVTGPRAKLARQNGRVILGNIMDLASNSSNSNEVKEQIINLRNRLNYEMDSSEIIPVTIKYQCLRLLKERNKNIKDRANDNLINEIQLILNDCSSATKNNQQYIVHHLVNVAPLYKATNLCQNVPVIILSYSNNTIKARCCVPKHLRNGNFDAKQWLTNSVGFILNSSYVSLENEDLTLVCNMKTKKVNNSEWNILLKKSIEAAKNYADTHLR